MADKDYIYQKYAVTRTDGSSAPGGKHAHCEYFVLDVSHDAYSYPALLAYADACEREKPSLATDLRLMIPCTPKGEVAMAEHDTLRTRLAAAETERHAANALLWRASLVLHPSTELHGQIEAHLRGRGAGLSDRSAHAMLQMVVTEGTTTPLAVRDRVENFLRGRGR